MAFNSSAAFGQSSQPFKSSAAFGQSSQPVFGQFLPPNTANAFGAPASSISPPNGRITFGARATAASQPNSSNGASQAPLVWGPAAGDSQNSPKFGAGAGGVFGSAGASQSAQGPALGTTPPFGGTSPGSTAGFAGFTGTSNFSNGQQTKGFGSFGAVAAAVSSPPAASSPFARLGTRVVAAPAADMHSNGSPNGFGTPVFGRLGQTAQSAAAGTSAAQPSAPTGIVFGNQQATAAFGFGTGSSLGTNPFAVPTSGAPVQHVDFGRAAKRKQPQQQQAGAGQQQQAQADRHRPEQQPKRSKAPAVLHRQVFRQRQTQPLSTDLADPAALAARSQRFGPGQPQPGEGSTWGPSGSAVPTEAEEDTTDDQQGTVP